MLQGAGYATAAGGGAYLAMNKQLWSSKERRNYVEKDNGMAPSYSEIEDELGLVKNIGTGTDYASGAIGLTQLGMIEYRKSLPLSSKIGTFSNFRNSTYKDLKGISTKLSRVGYVGAGASFITDVHALRTGQIGPYRFGLRAGSLATSIYVGASIGGPWGAVGGTAVGGIQMGVEYIYDNVLHPLWREVGYRIWTFENACNNGWKPRR